VQYADALSERLKRRMLSDIDTAVTTRITFVASLNGELKWLEIAAETLSQVR